jgi:hypothetical protein
MYSRGKPIVRQSLLWIFNSICPFSSFSLNSSLKYLTHAHKLLKHDLNLVTMIKKFIHLEIILRILFSNNEIEAMKLIHPRELRITDNTEAVIKQSKNLFFLDESDKSSFSFFNYEKLDLQDNNTRNIFKHIINYIE